MFNKLTFFAALSVAIISCSGKKETKTIEEKAPALPTVKSDGMKIAFYYLDSVKVGFKYYKTEEDKLTQKSKNFEAQMMARQKDLIGMQQRFQERYQAGSATAEQIGAMESEIKRKDQQLVQFQQSQGGALEKEALASNEALMKKMESAGKKYSEKYGIDILLVHGQGGQVNFIHPRMNVTKSFIDFLNHEEELMEQDMGVKK